MSHTVRTKFKGFVSLPTLDKAFKALGWDTKVNTTCRTWSSNPDRDRVYELVGINPWERGYDVAAVRQNDQTFALEGDFTMMDQGVWDTLGADFCKLRSQYSLETARQWAEANGGLLTTETLPDGTLDISIELA